MQPAIDLPYLTTTLLDLLRVPSPTGFTHIATEYVTRQLEALSIHTSTTPKGALIWTLPGQSSAARTVTCHIDTLGAMVKEIKKNGRLKLSAVGSYDWATIEGANCLVHMVSGEAMPGTIVNIKQSSHVHGSELRDLKRTEAVMEVRLDALTSCRDDTQALGIQVGDFVSFNSAPIHTSTGFIKGRHLDNKAAVAICLAATKTLVSKDTVLPQPLHFFVSNYEEVGHGAAAGIPADISELLCIDMAAVGQGQASCETCVTLCVKDSSGPDDFILNQRLRRLAAQHNIDLKIDIYPYYGSDASAAWRSGGSYSAALIGPGVDASHAYERTHEKALIACTNLLLAYALEV